MRIMHFGFLILICLVSLGMLFGTLELSFKNAAIPRAAGLVVLILGLWELYKMGRVARSRWADSRTTISSDELKQKSLMAGWLVFTVLTIYLVGFVYGVAVSALVFFRVFVYSHLWQAALASLACAFFILTQTC